MINASAGNRTRVTSMATMYSTTRPLMPLHSVAERAISKGLFVVLSPQCTSALKDSLINSDALDPMPRLLVQIRYSHALQACLGVLAGCTDI